MTINFDNRKQVVALDPVLITFFKRIISSFIIVSLFMGDLALCMDQTHEDTITTPLIKATDYSKGGNEDDVTEEAEATEDNKKGVPSNNLFNEKKEEDNANDPSISNVFPSIIEIDNTGNLPSSLRVALLESIKFYAPYMISQIAVTGNGIWNGYIYGRLGGAALQAEAVTLTYEFLIMGTCMGGLRATSIIAGQLNRKDQDENKRRPVNNPIANDERVKIALGNVNKTAFILTSIYSGVAMLLFWQAGNIVGGIGLVSDPEIIEQINDYFSGFLVGAAPTLYLFGDEQFSLGLKDPKAAGIFGTLYASISSLIAYPLSVGAWGIPALGVRGIGYAMSIGPWVSWVSMRGYYMCNEKYKGIDMRHFNTLKKASFKKYLEYSVPLGLTNSIGLITDFFTSQFITGFSNTAAASYSAASAYFIQLDIILLGYSSAISAQIANFDPRKAVGSLLQKNAQMNVKRYIMASVFTSVGFAVVCSLPALIWQGDFIDFFAGDQPQEVLNLSKKYLWFIAGQEIVNTYSNAIEAAIHGLLDIGIPFGIDVGSDGLSLLSVGLVAKYAENPMWLVAASSVVCVVTAFTYSGRLYSVGKKIATRAAVTFTNGHSWFKRTWNKITSWFRSDVTLEEAFENAMPIS